jgi:O-antigen ligase
LLKEKFIKQTDKTLQVMFVFWCLILPWSMAGMQIALGAVILLSILLSVFNHRSPFIYHPFYIFLGIYLLTDLISAGRTDDVTHSLNSVFQNDWVILTIPFLVSLPLKALWRKKGFRVLLLSAAVAGLYGIFQFFSGVDIFKGETLTAQGNFFRAIGGYGGFYTYGGNQLFAFAAAFAFFILAGNQKIERYVYLLFAAIIFLSIVASFTRSAWLAVIFVILLGTLIVNRKKFLYVLGGLILSGAVLFFLIPDLQSRFISIFDLSQNEGRLTLWLTSWEIFKENIFFGIGHGNFSQYFEMFKVPGFYDAIGHAHNDFINVTVLNGIIGLAAWLAMWIAWFYFAVKAFSKNLWKDADKKIILSAILGISGILVAALFQCFFTDLENNIFWWFLGATALQIIVQSGKRIDEENISNNKQDINIAKSGEM